MDIQASFERHWMERFPTDKPPTVSPTGKTMGVNNISSDSRQLSGATLNAYSSEAVKHEAQIALLACEKRIDRIEKELMRERFMRDYLENFLASDSFNNIDRVEHNVSMNGTATTAVSTDVLNNSSANLPDPWDVGLGEVSYRVIKGKHSRVSSVNNKPQVTVGKGKHGAQMPTSAIPEGSIDLTKSDTSFNVKSHSAVSEQAIDKCLPSGSINIPAVLKCDSEQATCSYVDSESVIHKLEQAVATADISSTLDKSTSTEISAELLSQTGSITTCGKTNFRPVPLPRPKRQPRLPLTDLFNNRAVDKGSELTERDTHSGSQPPGLNSWPGIPCNGTEDLPGLHKAGNSFGVRRNIERVQSSGLISQVDNQTLPECQLPSSGEIRTFTGDENVFFTPVLPGLSPGIDSSTRDSSIEPFNLKEDIYSEGLSDLCHNTPVGGAGFSYNSADKTRTFSTENSEVIEEESVSQPTVVKSGSQSNKNLSEKMPRKLGHKNGLEAIAVTGLKYQTRNAYETIEFVEGTTSLREIDQQVNMASTEMNTTTNHHDNNRLSSSVEDDSSIPVIDISDNSDYREPLYETLVVDKSCHAALTTEDESFDSLSLNSSDNDAARSDGDLSVDSGVGSKLSVDSHQPISPELLNSIDSKDPYAALYATVSKLKHETGISNQNNDQPNMYTPVVADKPAVPFDRIREKRSNESVNMPAYQNPTYNHPEYSNGSDDLYIPSQISDSSSRQLRREHEYEDCIPPGLEPAIPARPPVNEAPELPARMRIHHSDGKPGSNRSSQETISSQRNSYDLDHVDNYSSDSSDGDHNVTSPEKEKQRLRKLVLCGILETEKDYLGCLELLNQYMNSLEAAAASSKPVISPDDIKVIFHKIPVLCSIHTKFVRDLGERVKNWSPLQNVGDLFKVLILNFPVYSDYMKNYSKAVELIRKCSEEKPMFKELAETVWVPNSKEKEKTCLQNMLFKPVVRIQRNTLVLHDLMNCTPKSHPDYIELENALSVSHLNLEEFEDPTMNNSSSKIEQQQHLVKNSFMVESEKGQRKLRYIFLFSDVIVVTKQKVSGRSQRHNFEVKWYAPLSDIILTDHRIDQPGGDSNRDSRLSNMEEVEDLKKRVCVLKAELRQEMKKEKENETKEKSWSFASRAATKAIEKIKKKLHEQEAQLVQASPNLPFKMYHKASGKSYIFLMSTDYEREEWSEAILANQAKFKSDLVSKPPTSYDIQMLIENVKQLPKVNSVGNVLLRNSDDDGLHGILNVTIHRLSGLQKPSDTFCCLELDSYGHFFMTARTNVCRGEENPMWDEEFEIDLDGSQTLRILCYRRGNDSEGDVLLGKCALELKTHWLREKFKENVISLNEYSLVVSIRYVSPATTMKRLPSRLKSGAFGVKITTLAKREGRKMPIVVTSCIEEIERRGMDETGIYRVSGVTSDVQRLKKGFDKNSRAVVRLLADYDIHAVAGALKLYFRELPEPLFTEALYGNFINSLDLTDAEAKEKCMLSLLHMLPDASLRTVIYLIDHFIRISNHQDENRMNLNNLATIFGPTLLRPAAKDLGKPSPDMLFLGAQEAISQTAVLFYFIKLREGGKDLSKPTAPSPTSKA